MQVWSLFSELRFHMPQDEKTKKKERKQTNKQTEKIRITETLHPKRCLKTNLNFTNCLETEKDLK